MLKINESSVNIMVRDLDASIKFYESVGLTLKNRWENHYAMVEAPGILIGLHPSEEKDPGSGTVSIGFMIDSIEEAIKLMEANQIKYSFSDGKSGKYVHFSDPDGTELYFTEPKWKY